MKNKVLVTGSCGFIGHHLVKELKLRGFYVIGVDNLYGGDKKYADLSDEFLLKNWGDLTEDELLDVKWVFHLAAIPSVPYSIKNPQQTQKNNVDETLSLLLLSKKVGIEKFVFSSSSSVYGEQAKFPTDEKCQTIPISPYAVQKLCAEQYCEIFRKIYGLPTVSLRYFNVYGEEQRADNPYTGVITKFIKLKKQGEPLNIYGTGLQRRDFTYVGDVVDANILTAEKGEGVYNVGTGTNISINELASIISENIVHSESKLGDPLLSLANPIKLKELGWNPKMDLMSWLGNIKL